MGKYDIEEGFNRIVLVVSTVVAVGMCCLTIVNPTVGILFYYTEDVKVFVLIDPFITAIFFFVSTWIIYFVIKGIVKWIIRGFHRKR